ncbi:Alkyl hydroperoxide reductase C [Candidatus Rhabdochlamydia oedothoracis]|uniref:Thioredoxin peroxidase n=1 Tax=Candidatus Rhabdochlamydia oedothoracis TaxID=2720720 RepID=A0ABX8V3R2_9BACT|nr:MULTISPECIES: peroxiredoxin [Rhabdochlamydia]KAG6559947.1 putative peroxiredoxin [Candidatus Rhabdochlamydia sp. W815]MCL6756120.1 peroxiredoxin [Candidatus Rhabdochlamydia oedothoracis]QYF48095.1 Alkyl hydroperoxide reductase C [Candidatus Rhabdochlamydia oedothoracis]
MSRLLIGKKAPSFRAKAAQGDKIIDGFSLDDFLGQYVVLFFYPLDFTFVCPTEVHAFQEALQQFKQRNAQVIGCSVDSGFSHLAWLSTPKAKGGIEGIEYPIISDLNKKIANDYGVLHEEEGIAYRGLFLIDRQGMIRHLLINDFPIGRSVEEVLRILDALICFEMHGEVCPANWSVGKKTMQPDAVGLVHYFS